LNVWAKKGIKGVERAVDYWKKERERELLFNFISMKINFTIRKSTITIIK
jgi:hypothetical protein